jgi:predicted membrane protein
VNHGFVRAANGTITTFSAPGAGTTPHGGNYGTAGTGSFSINTAGIIAGTYTDANFVAHGFVRAANGTITAFDAPGAGNNALLAKLIGMATSFPSQGTGAFTINAVGKITGTYLDASTVLHGFVINATTTTLTSSPNPSTYGQAVTFTAKVASSVGAPPDGETIAFMNGNTALGTGTLSGGSASLTTSTLKVGTALVTAVYSGDSRLVGSTSRTVRQVVR